MRVKELIEALQKFDEDYFVQIRKPNGVAYRDIQHVRKALARNGGSNIIVIEYFRSIK